METMTSTAGRHRGYITTRRYDEDLAHLRHKLGGELPAGTGKHRAEAQR